LKAKLKEENPYLLVNGNHILQYSSSTSISFPFLLALWHCGIEKHKKNKKNRNKGPREGNPSQALVIIMTPLKTKLSSTRNS
jgi:hypothetical protein